LKGYELLRAAEFNDGNVDAPLYDGFSKKMENYEHALAPNFMHYNFCRISSDVARHTSNGSRDERPCLVS
jgi:hypothetical protein